MRLPFSFYLLSKTYQRAGLLSLLSLLSGYRLFSRSPASAQIARATSDLTVEVTRLRNPEGQVCVSIFPGSAGFPRDESNIVGKQCVTVLDSELTSVSPTGEAAINDAILAITFTGLEPSTYAVSAMHDENADGALNTGLFGIPVEGFGFSQNPDIGMGPPEFSEAVITVFGPDTTTQVELVYY